MIEPTIKEQIAAVRSALSLREHWLSMNEPRSTIWLENKARAVALRAALATLEASQSNGWRDIATAPKDGTLIDVWLGDASATDIEFYCTPGTKRSAGWQWLRDKWCACVGGLQMSTFVVPTHWQPLPPPPTQPEGDKQ